MIILRRTRHFASSLTLFLFLASCALAQSSGPREPQQDDAATERQEETNNQLRAIASELSAIRVKQAETEQRTAAYEAEQRNQVYWPPIWSNWVLAFFAAAAAFIAVRSLIAINRQVAANIDAATAAKTSAEAFMLSERAVVKMFPIPPGIVWTEERRYDIQFKVKNFGNTPARVTDVVIKPDVRLTNERLPEIPDYSESLTGVEHQARGSEAGDVPVAVEI